ncbi:DUF6979 family protein [Virgibacillus sp. DJP39]|uniref:DUF6979 family protein n=1 Tax=Virgibacillus sp. DJP39 TaxID=3409790 RepID=UPI003BB533BC
MGKYGQAALKAVNLIKINREENPIVAWQSATTEIFGEGTSSQRKACPKSTFLGLCEEGFISEVKPGNYSTRKGSKNKDYGIKAIQLLKKQPSLSNDAKQLWDKVLEGEIKKPNSQMDVVISLWENDLIR